MILQNVCGVQFFLSKGKIITVLKNNVMKTYQGYGCKTPAILIPELYVDNGSSTFWSHLPA